MEKNLKDNMEMGKGWVKLSESKPEVGEWIIAVCAYFGGYKILYFGRVETVYIEGLLKEDTDIYWNYLPER